MKPFDLEAAKRGEPIMCRDGRPAKFIAHVLEARPYPRIVALLGSESIATYTEQGAYYTGGVESEEDLFMAPHKVKHHAWVNLYRNGLGGSCYSDKKSAESQANDGVAEIRCIEWEVEE